MPSIDVEKIRAVYTAPYYLSMVDLDEAELLQFTRLAQAAELGEVLWMLNTEEWRCRKAGAWFALTRHENAITEALRLSLLTSKGDLTAPDLGVCLAERLGTASLPVLLDYQSIGIRDDHGLQGGISALITALGGTPLVDDASEFHNGRVSAMRETARRIARL